MEGGVLQNSKFRSAIRKRESFWENFRDVRIVLFINLEVGPNIFSECWRQKLSARYLLCPTHVLSTSTELRRVQDHERIVGLPKWTTHIRWHHFDRRSVTLLIWNIVLHFHLGRDFRKTFMARYYTLGLIEVITVISERKGYAQVT